MIFHAFLGSIFLHSKDEVLRVFSTFKCQVENLLQHTIKILRTDGSIEYKTISRSFPSIVHQLTCPYTPQQNGVSERKHRHIVELALANMAHASIPEWFWDDIFSSVVYLINRMPSPNSSSSPYSKLFHKNPDYKFLRILGCLCFPYMRPYNKHKLQPRSKPCIFLGYPISQKGYKCLDLATNKIFISRHVVFDEFSFPFKKQLSGSNSTTAAPLDWATWLPVLTSQPPTASCASQHASCPALATVDQVLPSQITLPQSRPIISHPTSSSASLKILGASTFAADPPHPTFQPLLLTHAPGTTCAGSDPALSPTPAVVIGSIHCSDPTPAAPDPKLLRTYSRRHPSSVAPDPTAIQTLPLRAKASVSSREPSFLPKTPGFDHITSSHPVSSQSQHQKKRKLF